MNTEPKFIREWRKSVYKPPRYDSLNREEWRQIRKAILIRDDYACLRCEKKSKSGKGLSIHHIVPRDDDGGNNYENLITLCHSCHDFVEVEKLRSLIEIIGSIDPTESKLEPKKVESDDWRSWVYGGGRNPNLDSRR